MDFSGNKSAFTSSVSATTTYLDDNDFENGIRQIFIDADLDVIEPVSSLPASGDFTGQTVYLTTDGKLYNWNGSSWAASAAGAESFSDLTGSIAASQIPTGVITEAKLGSNSVTAAKIAANAVGASEIAASSITGAKIAASTITVNKISANTITGGLLTTSGIITSTAQIGNSLITNAKIDNLAVTTAKIGNNAVTFPQSAISTTVTDLGASSSLTTLQTLTVSRSGAPAQIVATCHVTTTGSSTTGYGVFHFYLYRGSSLVSGFNNSKVQGLNSFDSSCYLQDTLSGTQTYYLKAQGVSLNGTITAIRFISPVIQFIELKK